MSPASLPAYIVMEVGRLVGAFRIWRCTNVCTATHCNTHTLQHAATRCDTLQYAPASQTARSTTKNANSNLMNALAHQNVATDIYSLTIDYLVCVAVCCGVLQWVAVGCSGLQWVAVRVGYQQAYSPRVRKHTQFQI